MFFHCIAERDAFLQEVVRKISLNLPQDLNQVKLNFIPGNNWIVFRYSDLPNCSYELHLAQRSKNHEAYFGEGEVEIVAFYYKAAPANRAAWLKEIQEAVPAINKHLVEPVVVGEWVQDWAWLALNLRKFIIGDYNPDIIAEAVAGFIRVTYQPVHKALRAIS